MKLVVWFWLFCLTTTDDRGDINIYRHRLNNCLHSHYSCEGGTKNVICSCDRMCLYYDNCCFDAPAIKDGGKRDTHDNERLKQYLKMTTCETTSFRDGSNVPQGALMVSSCPLSWNRDIVTKEVCELSPGTDVRDMLPVTDTSTNVTFKNRKCAKCHNVQKYLPWQLKIGCKSEMSTPSHFIHDVVMEKLLIDHCSYRFIPPINTNVQYCYDKFNYVMVSNSSEIDNSSTCQDLVFSPVLIVTKSSATMYRHLKCLLASENTTYEEVYNITFCLETFHKKQSDNVHTLSILIDFSSLFRRKATTCQEQEIQLSDKVGCHHLFCPARTEPSGGECMNISLISDGLILDLLFETIVGDYKLQSFQKTLEVIFIFITALTKYTGININLDARYLRYMRLIKGVPLNGHDGTCSAIHTFLPLKGLILSDDTLEFVRSWTKDYFNNFTTITRDGSVMRHIADVEHMSCKTNISVRNPVYLKEMFSVDNELPCPAVKLQHSQNESNDESQINNASFPYYHLQGINIEPVDVVFANGDYFVCIEIFLSKYRQNYEGYYTIHNYRTFINTACSSISIICMIFCLVQYCLFPIVRYGKSELVIALILFLISAQICFLLLSSFAVPKYSCEWFGVIQHFVWLGAFAFMFLCPYRLNSEIRSLQTYTKSDRLLGTIKYVLVGLSFPFIITLCTKITNVLLEPHNSWHGGHFCFISQTHVLLAGFVVPISLILFGNVILLICIIHYISSTSNSANANKSNMLIFIKISTVMGFSWIVGIVAVISQAEALLLIFEILAHLQGALITISFTCNNRMRKLYADYFQQCFRIA